MKKIPLVLISLAVLMLIIGACAPQTRWEEEPGWQPPAQPSDQPRSAGEPSAEDASVDDLNPDEVNEVTADLDSLDW